MKTEFKEKNSNGYNEEMVKDRHKILDREIGATLSALDDLGETNMVGIMNGWEYSFKKTSFKEKEELV